MDRAKVYNGGRLKKVKVETGEEKESKPVWWRGGWKK